MSVVSVRGLTVEPREKTKGYLDAGTCSVYIYRVHLAVVNGAVKGKTVAFIGGSVVTMMRCYYSVNCGDYLL